MTVEVFTPGTVVRLKSGGPDMTVLWLGYLTEATKPPAAKCLWFDGDKLTESWFAISNLELVRE